MANRTKNLSILRNCGVPEWLLEDQDWAGFMTFFKENITDANILTDEELVELDRMKKTENGHEISLAKRMDDVARNYPGIWSVNEEEINNLEEMIEIIGQEEDFYDDLIAKTKSTHIGTIEELTALNLQKTKLLSEEPLITDKCLGQMEKLQEVKLLNERKISELGQLYSKPVQNPLFMHQMPLNDYFRQLDQFNCNARHFLRKNFKVQNNEGGSNADELSKKDEIQAMTELGIVADRLVNSYNKLYLSEMDLNAKKVLKNQFKEKNWSPSTLMGMRREMVEMERDLELNEVQKQHLINKLEDQATEMGKLDVEVLIYESNQKRMGRAKQRMDYLNRFANVISETMSLSEIFWSLMQLDMERMKNRNIYDSKLEAYRMESLRCNRRIDLMNMIGKISEDALVQRYCNQIMDLLQINQRGYGDSTVEQIIKVISSVNDFKSNIMMVIKNSTMDISSPSQSNAFFKQTSFIEGLISKFLYDGPIEKPQQHSEWYRKKCENLQCELAKIRIMNEMNKEKCVQINQKWSNDKYWRMKQLLWIWFMTEPKKVIKALKMINGEAQLKTKIAAAIPQRHTVGIVRKS